MSSETLLLWLAVMVALLAINAFFVAVEFALIALRQSRVQELVDEGSATALIVQKLQKNIDASVSGAQLGITFASLALGWVSEPAIHGLIKLVLGLVPGLSGAEPPPGVGLVLSLLVMSVLHVVLGEQVPKCSSLRLAEPVAMMLARPFAVYCKVVWPLIWLLDRMTNACLNLVGVRKQSESESQVHSAVELEILFDQSQQAGELHPRETELLKGVFALDQLTAAEVMVPRARMDSIDRNMSLRDALAVANKTKHSKLPVTDATSGKVVGVLHVRDLFAVIDTHAQAQSDATTVTVPKSVTLDKLVRDVYRIAGTVKARDVLDGMRKHKVQVAIVHDDMQGVLGLVTMEDVLEHLVGDIFDEYDKQAKNKTP